MRVVLRGIFILIFGAFACEVSAQLREEWEIPISKLPGHVEYSKGKFSIFADFEHGKNGAVMIFMINDTDKDIRLPAQDRDVYLKQEARVDGKWLRSQPHRYSWCGNSYMSAPSISAKHFAIQSSEFNGWVPKVKLAENDKSKVLPVRYRFYTDAYFDVISNQGEMPVSLELIKLSEFDTMALNFATVEKLALVATGEVEVKSLDHMKSKWTAVSKLAKFPGNLTAQKAVRIVIEGLYGMKKESGRNNYEVRQALNIVANVFGVDEAQTIYLDLIKDGDFPFREEALTSLVYGVKERGTETDSLLDGFLKSYDDPFFLKALGLRVRSWSKEEKRKELKRVYQDTGAPEVIRKYAKNLYYGVFPNPYIRLRTKYLFDSALVDISIENISKESIQLEYSHPYDLITSQVELNFGTTQVPYRKDFKELVDSERSEKVKRVLKPGGKLVFSSVNIWRYHDIPASLPKQFYYRVISKLPQFGDVPAGVGSTGFFESKHEMKRKILMNAIEEQR